MNLEKLDADERDLCLGVGEDLTGICFSFDFSKKMSVNPPRLSPENRKRLFDKMIFYKIFYVESTCQAKLDTAHYKFLVEGITKTLSRRLSADKFAALEDELLACSKIPFNENSVGQLAQHAGISTKTFNADDWKQLKVWVGAEILGADIAVNAAIKHLNTPPSERKSANSSTEQSARPAQNVRKTIPVNRSAQPARKKTSWGKWLTIAAVALIALFAFNYDGSRDASPKQNRPAQTVSETVAKPTPVEKPEPIVKPKPVTKPKPIKPVAKIGVMTGYDYDHPILNTDGLCEYTVDNTRNDMPVYARIWDVTAQLPVRAFTIAQGDKFTVENLSPGTYELRYMELYENDVPPYGNKSEPITLEQYGTSYSTVSLTLYKVYNGNTTTTRIDASDV